jgi:PAS domain-containing protein
VKSRCARFAFGRVVSKIAHGPPPERRRKEQLIADLAARHYAAIVESSDDAIVSKDLDGVIVSWNRGAQVIFGYTAEEAVGKPVTILIPTDRYDEEPFILERIRRGEKIVTTRRSDSVKTGASSTSP